MKSARNSIASNPESFQGWPLKDISVTQRGDSKTPKAPARDGDRSSGLDVLNAVRRLMEEKRANVLDYDGNPAFAGATPLLPRIRPSSQSGVTAAALQNEFTTADAYAFTRELEELHPNN